VRSRRGGGEAMSNNNNASMQASDNIKRTPTYKQAAKQTRIGRISNKYAIMDRAGGSDGGAILLYYAAGYAVNK
jgi:hypothetical protein